MRAVAQSAGGTGIFDNLISSVLFLRNSVTVSRTISSDTEQVTVWKAPER